VPAEADKTPLQKIQAEFGVKLTAITKTGSVLDNLARALYILNGVTDDDLELALDGFEPIPERGRLGAANYRAAVTKESVIENTQAPYKAMAALLISITGLTDPE
tara:strand:+ start:43 stop:357 length:315 start_codon:yes stop_codon:yes gene_type:complete